MCEVPTRRIAVKLSPAATACPAIGTSRAAVFVVTRIPTAARARRIRSRVTTRPTIAPPNATIAR